MRHILLASASLFVLAGAADAAAQVPPNLGQPLGPASLNGSGVLPGGQIPFGTTTGTVGDGGVLATTSSTANTANTNATTANTNASAAVTTANAALPKAGGTVTGTLISGALMVDGSKQRTSATGAAITVAAATNWVSLVQSGTVAAQTLTLPSAPVDGQTLKVNTVGAITALTFSPAVPGWTNGSQLPANTGIVIGYDGTTPGWMRISS